MSGRVDAWTVVYARARAMSKGETDLRVIQDVADALRQARDRGDSASILIGAGASVTAGIPLAQSFVEGVQERFPTAYARAEEKTYPHVMRQLNDGERHDLIARHVGQARLNWAHILLGWLVHTGYVGRVLTTNFDNLVQRCTGLYGVHPAVYDVTAFTKFNASLVRDPAVFFLHGQHSGFVQLHTPDEVKKDAKRLRPIFADATVRRPWIVLGYSGDNDPVFECLTGVKRFHYGLYWIGYRDMAPSQAVSQRLLSRERQAYLVPGYDADSFMVALFRALELDLPPLLGDPFGHGLAVLEQFAPFPTAVGEEDFTASARSYFEAAKRWFVDGVVPVSHDGHHDEQTRLAMQGYLFRGDYDAIVGATGDGEVPPALRRLVAVALGLRAAQAGEQAREAQRHMKDDSQLIAAALADLDRAIALAPDFAELYTDRAGVRLAAAAVRTNSAFEEFAARAHADLGEALRIQPDLHPAVHNLAYHDALVADRLTGALRSETFERALAGFRRACELNPDHVLSWVMGARALVALGREDPARLDEAKPLLAHAEGLQPQNFELVMTSLAVEFYQKSASWLENPAELPALLERARLLQELDSDDVRARFLLGLLQTLSAILSPRPESRAMFDAGWRIYLETRELMRWNLPTFGVDLDRLRLFMAMALWVEAEHRESEERAKLYASAEAELLAAAAIPGQEAAVFRHWAGALAGRAENEEGPAREELFDRADEKFTAVLAAMPDDPDVMVEWARAKVSRISTADTANEAAAAHDMAVSLLRRAESLQTTPEISFVWALACKSLGDVLDEDLRALPLLREAIVRYESALTVSGDDAEHWGEYAECAQGLAELLAEQPGGIEEARSYFSKAVSAWARATELDDEIETIMAQMEALLDSAAFEDAQGETDAAAVLARQAEELLEVAARRDHQKREALMLLLGVHDERGNVDGIEAVLLRLAQLSPPITRHELAEQQYGFLEAPPPALHTVLAGLAP